MRRILLPVAVVIAAAALPGAAQAAVVSTVSADTLHITGDVAADAITLRLAPGAPGTLQVDTQSADFAFDRTTFSRISVRSGAGDDDVRVDEANGAFTDAEATTIESGAGADLVLGGRGAEVIASGDDGDLVFAAEGDDSLVLGGGDDTAIQSSNDGFDSFDGQSGSDVLQTAGTAESEEFTVQGVGSGARISRDVGFARADMTAIETILLNAAGGPDLVDVGDLSGSGVTRLDADLGLNDGARDTVFTAGRSAADDISVSALGDTPRILGLPGEVRLENAQPSDRLTVQAGNGTDKLTAIGNVGALIGLTLEGNELQDQLTGGSGNETLRGGPDADILRGNAGNDVVQGDGGPDHVVWNRLADGSDTIDGGTEQDRIRVPSSAADDTFEVSALLTHVRLKAEPGVQSDLTSLEVIDLGAATGADKITVNDLSGTDTIGVVVDLGPADLKVDSVTISGTQGADSIKTTATSFSHDITGLPATVFLTGAEPGDRLTINGGDGEDTIDAGQMSKDKLQPFLNGGAAKDVIAGSPGQDEVTGGPGDDVIFLRDGLDTAIWQAGDGSDILEGGAGTDFLRMNGSGANERFVVSPIGGRTILTRDVANIRIDMGDLERLDIMPAGGADTMHVDDMSGTDTKVVTWELAPFRGTTASDGSQDSVTVNGSNGSDNITVTAGGQQVRVAGLATVVEVNRADKSLDTLVVDTRLGSDSIFIAPQVHNLLKFSSA
jgi:Ca2+-binding RTX toxin-like protein